MSYRGQLRRGASLALVVGFAAAGLGLMGWSDFHRLNPIRERLPYAMDVAVDYANAYASLEQAAILEGGDAHVAVGRAQSALALNRELYRTVNETQSEGAPLRLLLDAQADLLRWIIKHGSLESSAIAEAMSFAYGPAEEELLGRLDGAATEAWVASQSALGLGANGTFLRDGLLLTPGIPKLVQDYQKHYEEIVGQRSIIEDAIAPYASVLGGEPVGQFASLERVERHLSSLSPASRESQHAWPSRYADWSGEATEFDRVAYWLREARFLGASDVELRLYAAGNEILPCGHARLVGERDFCPRPVVNPALLVVSSEDVNQPKSGLGFYFEFEPSGEGTLWLRNGRATTLEGLLLRGTWADGKEAFSSDLDVVAGNSALELPSIENAGRGGVVLLEVTQGSVTLAASAGALTKALGLVV